MHYLGAAERDALKCSNVTCRQIECEIYWQLYVMLNIKEIILICLCVLCHTAEWLWIYTIMLQRCIDLNDCQNLKMFCKVLKKISSQLAFSANEIQNAMSLHLFEWLCSDRCSGSGSPFEESLRARLVLPSGIHSHIQ